MFDFHWSEDLRYVTFYCCPLSHREQVLELLEIAGIDEEELARRLGVATTVVRRWADGDVKPQIATLDRIARACEVDIGPGFGEERAARLRGEPWPPPEVVPVD